MMLSCLPSPPLTPGASCVSQFETGLASGLGIFFGPSADNLERFSPLRRLVHWLHRGTRVRDAQPWPHLLRRASDPIVRRQPARLLLGRVGALRD